MFGKKREEPAITSLSTVLPDITRVVGGRRYSTATSTLLADGVVPVLIRRFLYRTAKGNFFEVRRFIDENVFPLSESQAIEAYQDSPTKHVEWEEAFPGSPVEDA